MNSNRSSNSAKLSNLRGVSGNHCLPPLSHRCGSLRSPRTHMIIAAAQFLGFLALALWSVETLPLDCTSPVLICFMHNYSRQEHEWKWRPITNQPSSYHLPSPLQQQQLDQAPPSSPAPF